MSIRFLGGIITNNATQPTLTSAKGVWTLSQQSQAKYANAWPLGTIPDPQFNYVTALLNGNGINGAQNNTFLDSSTNNFTITRNGNTTQGSFSPYGNNWSYYFDGGTNRLTTATSSLFNLSGANITLECWVYMASAPSVTNRLISIGPNSVQSSLVLAINTNRTFEVAVPFGSGGGVGSGANLIPLNTWTNLTFVLSGSTGTLYLNGTQVGQTTGWNITSTTSNYFYLGYDATATVDGKFTGYVSNARLVIGAAEYTGPFTPSTAPLQPVANTRMLTAQSNRFIDASSNNISLTVNGSLSVQRFNPFGTATSYSTSVIGGSGYFDGSGDSLQAPSVACISGTGDFTAECWIYPTTAPATYNIIGCSDTLNGLTMFGLNANGTIFYGRSLFNVEGTTSNACNYNAWNHIAISRSSGTVKIFVNGVQGFSATSTYSFASGIVRFGTDGGGSALPYTGYISNFRIIQNSAIYTSNFTPPTAPLTAITNTSLLLNMTNAGIYDSAMMNNLETVGNAQVSTSVVKYGTGSMYFDGTGDYLTAPPNQNFAFNTGNYTVEAWVYITSFATTPIVFDTRASGPSVVGVAVYFNPSGNAVAYINASNAITSASTYSTNIWYHIALVRSGSVNTLYVNGTSVGTYNFGTSLTDNWLTVGTVNDYRDTSSTFKMSGYIDDLRITKGYARYTANFTPPTAAFPTAGP